MLSVWKTSDFVVWSLLITINPLSSYGVHAALHSMSWCATNNNNKKQQQIERNVLRFTDFQLPLPPALIEFHIQFISNLPENNNLFALLFARS